MASPALRRLARSCLPRTHVPELVHEALKLQEQSWRMMNAVASAQTLNRFRDVGEVRLVMIRQAAAEITEILAQKHIGSRESRRRSEIMLQVIQRVMKLGRPVPEIISAAVPFIDAVAPSRVLRVFVVFPVS